MTSQTENVFRQKYDNLLPASPWQHYIEIFQNFFLHFYRKLRERLDDYDMEKAEEEGETWLEIIVGSGHHSKVTYL